MNIFSDSFRATIWFLLCLVMAIGMIVFAVVFAIASSMIKKFAWTKFSFPQFRFVK